MSKNTKKKVKNYNKRPKLSKKQERKLARFGQKMRREERRRREVFAQQTDEWVGEELERRRIKKEVEQEMEA